MDSSSNVHNLSDPAGLSSWLQLYLRLCSNTNWSVCVTLSLLASMTSPHIIFKASPPLLAIFLNSYRRLLPVSSFLLPLSSSHSLSHALLCISGPLGCHQPVVCIFRPTSEIHAAAVEADWLPSRAWCIGCRKGESGVRPHKGRKSGKTDAVLTSSAALNYWPARGGGGECVYVSVTGKSMCAQVLACEYVCLFICAHLTVHQGAIGINC